MTLDQQRIAIAQACGWTPESGVMPYDGVEFPWTIWHKDGKTHNSCPDYLNDLNACHEMEQVLTSEQHIDHMEWLGMCSDDYGQKIWAYVHATASQRAEAFLRTLNLWTVTPTQPQ